MCIAKESLKFKSQSICQDITAGEIKKWPEPFDTDWLVVHSAYIYAAEQGKGIPFCLAVYRSRFIEGRNVGDEAVLRDASIACGLDADILIEAHGKRKYKKKLLQGMKSAGEEGVFGVPFLCIRIQPIGGMTDLNGCCEM